MRSIRTRPRLATFAMVMAAATCAAACSIGAGGDAPPGGTPEPVVLRLANTSSQLDTQPAVQHFADRVAELSDGAVSIEAVHEWGEFASDAEQQVVRAVAAGDVDLGWVGSRVFDTIGVASFQALTAPMLIDSYALQDAVIQDGITEQMLQGLDAVEVAGLGVLPDGLRKPVGVAGAIVTVTDWEGITFGTLSSNGQAEAISALGATPENVFGHERAEALEAGTLDGFELGLFPYQQNRTWRQSAPYLTANVNLWPQMDVLLAYPARLEELSDEQRSWLTEAAEDAAGQSSALAASDAEGVGRICDVGARFANATGADIAALREAFAPVTEELRQDAQTAGFIDQIQALKESISAEPALAVPADCTGAVPTEEPVVAGDAPAYLNGTYQYVITQEEADAAGDPDENYPVEITITLTDGVMEGGCFVAGTYSVEGDEITFRSSEYGGSATASFSQDDDGSLHFTPDAALDPGDAFICFSKPWMKIA